MSDPERQKIAENIDKLDISEREKEIVRYRYGLEKFDTKTHTLEATGQVFGITRERVRQIEKKVKVLLGF